MGYYMCIPHSAPFHCAPICYLYLNYDFFPKMRLFYVNKNNNLTIVCYMVGL